MNFEKMKQIVPELQRLEESARFAGERGATWLSYLMASHECLSKLTGRGAVDERLQSAQCYEVARASIFAAWAKGEKAASPAVAVESSGQQAFIPTSEQYR